MAKNIPQLGKKSGPALIWSAVVRSKDAVGKSQNRARARIGKIERRKMLEHLDLLCSSGVGIEAIAPSVCEIFRRLVRADSGSVFWKDEHGEPRGYYHDCAPAEIKDFFVANFDTLFSHPDEMNMVGMMRPTQPNIGKGLLADWKQVYLTSNVYRYLSKPLGHEHMLDLRVDVAGRGRLLFCGWNGAGKQFSEVDAAEARHVHDLVLKALIDESRNVSWKWIGSRTAHFTTDIEGAQLLTIDTEAEQWLRLAHLLRQNIPMVGLLEAAPLFARDLASRLHMEPAAEMAIPVAAGRLAIRAVRSSVRGQADGAAQILVSLDMQQAEVVTFIEHLCALPLTMLQKRIALYSMQGGARQDCERVIGVGTEGLKKHLSTIYEVMNVGGWAELSSLKPAAIHPDFKI